MLFLLCAGLNVLLFYLTVSRRVDQVEAGQPAPLVARVLGGTSLVLWVAVPCAGRMIAFFKP